MKKLVKKYLIPHSQNNHQPHLLCTEAFLIIGCVILFLEIIFLVGISKFIPNSSFFASILPNVLVDETNSSRQAAQLPTLTINPLLTQAAALKAKDMVEKGYFAHTSNDGRTPWYWLQKVGYRFTDAGENLAVNFFDSKDVAQAWMNSITHRENILNPNFTEIGIATAQGPYQGKEAVFVVQLFGHPVPITMAQESAVTNERINSAAEIVEKESVIIKAAAISKPSTNLQRSPAPVSYQSSIIQKMFTEPRHLIAYLFFVLLTIIGVAVVLKIFINLKPEHSGLIINGALLLLLIASVLWINQYLSLIQTKIL